MKRTVLFNFLIGIALVYSSVLVAPQATAKNSNDPNRGLTTEENAAMVWKRGFPGPAWSNAEGWNAPGRFLTIQTADINGDGQDELLGRGKNGMQTWSYSDSSGWILLQDGKPDWIIDAWLKPEYYSTIQAADINGDGRAELLARRSSGIEVWRYDDSQGWVWHSNGPAWGDPNWTAPEHYSTIQTADINGDGRAELLGRRSFGIEAWRFDDSQGWVILPNGPAWANPNWTAPEYYSTIQTADINGDGRAELLGRRSFGIEVWRYDDSQGWVKLPNGPAWGDPNWTSPEYYSTIQTGDLNGDGRAELLARRSFGIEAWRYDDGQGWVKLPNGPAWADPNWTAPQYYRTIQAADVTGDGKAELLARRSTYIEVWSYDDITGWGLHSKGPQWSDKTGWNQAEYYRTIQTGDLNGDGRAELLGRTSTQIDLRQLSADVPPEQALELAFSDTFTLIWSGTTTNFYRPAVPAGFFLLGDFNELDPDQRGFTFAVRELVPGSGALAAPVDFQKVWGTTNTLWKPVPPPGYECLGLVAQAGTTKPGPERIRCVRFDLTAAGRTGDYRGRDGEFITYGLLPDFDPAIYFDTFTGIASTTIKPQITSVLDSRAVKPEETLTAPQVHALVQNYGPRVYFHPEELYFMDDPQYLLDKPGVLEWGLVENEKDYDTFVIKDSNSISTTSGTVLADEAYILNNVKPNSPYNNSPSFRYWLHIKDNEIFGDTLQNRSLAYLRVMPWNTLFTEVQFWFFYPFNGPGRALIQGIPTQLGELGRHYGDWECVSIRFINSQEKPVSVYMSAHGGGQMLPYSRMAKEGMHPVIYSAKYSHANYPIRNDRIIYETRPILGIGTFNLYDETGQGKNWNAYDNYQIISSTLFTDYPPDWLKFGGPWGQYIKNKHMFSFLREKDLEEVKNAPRGPLGRSSWNFGDFSTLFGWPQNYVYEQEEDEIIPELLYLYLPLLSRNP